MYFNISQNPTAYVTVGKNRLRVYNARPTNKVFMNDSNEFEIELFNPKTTPILAKIQLNGEYISHGGIVLNPGERVFLERYLEKDRKFKFTTYDVDSNNTAAQKAIQHNGKVRVEYYDEYKQPSPYPYWSSNVTYSTGANWDGNLHTFGGTTTAVNSSFDIAGSAPRSFFSSDTAGADVNLDNTFTTASMSSNICDTSNSATMDSLDFMPLNEVADMNMDINLEETGRIAEGNQSDQDFSYVDKQFNTIYFKCIEYQILPVSQKEKYEKSDIRTYCTNCGARQRKDSWKFCPKCGNKL